MINDDARKATLKEQLANAVKLMEGAAEAIAMYPDNPELIRQQTELWTMANKRKGDIEAQLAELD